MTEPKEQSNPTCRICNGNDMDAPCAYTTEKPEGCLRATRLKKEQSNPVAVCPRNIANAVAAVALMKAAEKVREVGRDWRARGYMDKYYAADYLAEQILASIPADHVQAARELLVEAILATRKTDRNHMINEDANAIADRILAEKGLIP